ncbi:MAG TPA: alkaline phosphatase PafA, partial [Sediminibacterium sp.]|nr:alkaline phosphatase PafA [Sediminibacterium sp.]
MKKIFLVAICFYGILQVKAQSGTKPSPNPIARPKLVVGIVIDQMRWDYLYRFYSLYDAKGGFKRLLGEGFSCDNTMIPYTPSVTACGHTCVYTGSVPAIHGITGNNWWDNQLNQSVYCSEDKSVSGVGGTGSSEGQMSPRNMLTTTIGDELRLATNFKSKVIGIAIKDRGAILPAGHAANAAYWYEGKSGNFITSTYYMQSLPEWANRFNERKIVDSLYRLNWNTLLPASVYTEYASADQEPYESKPFGKSALGFPYTLGGYAGKDYGKIASTPYGNTLTVEMAKAVIAGEQLGKGSATDFLAVSFSSPDYIGHAFGPNSWEMVDDYVRLDRELGRLFSYLDATIGKGQYTAFLTADHAVAHIPGFMEEHRLPGGVVSESSFIKEMNADLQKTFGIEKAITGIYNYQVVLNHQAIDNAHQSITAVEQKITDWLKTQEAIANAFPVADIMTTPVNQVLREKLANGYYPQRSGDIQVILKPGYIEGEKTGTTHGLWYPYDAHIPLVWYGWGIPHGASKQEVSMTDIAATLAALL